MSKINNNYLLKPYYRNTQQRSLSEANLTVPTRSDARNTIYQNKNAVFAIFSNGTQTSYANYQELLPQQDFEIIYNFLFNPKIFSNQFNLVSISENDILPCSLEESSFSDKVSIFFFSISTTIINFGRPF